jgi:hypothetical protein
MLQRYLHIDLGTDYTLDFAIHNTVLADLWLERMHLRHPYPLDHPDRFYNFNSIDEEIVRAEEMIRRCIDTINAYQPIVQQTFTNIEDHDCLNYLHSIFEQYHGLLGQPKTRWWLQCPPQVKNALAELNLAVHRCESVSRNRRPRLICTWFGVSRNVMLSEEVMQAHGTLQPAFGSVSINYTEIGKTLFELALDQDKYISDAAFKPFAHYAPDFVVNFYETTQHMVDKRLHVMKQYYQTHRDFFVSQGYPEFEHVKLLPLWFPVAQLIEQVPRDQLFEDIRQRQFVTKVYIDETSHHSHT